MSRRSEGAWTPIGRSCARRLEPFGCSFLPLGAVSSEGFGLPSLSDLAPPGKGGSQEDPLLITK